MTTYGILYQAIVKYVLLCGYEAWIVTASMLKTLVREKIVFDKGIPCIYPCIKLEDVWLCLYSVHIIIYLGLQIIEIYIEIQYNTVIE